jgi:hypothetical protein
MDIAAKKLEFMSDDWVEERHQFLKSLPVLEAKEMLESLDEVEVTLNVNQRMFQEAYIADYLTDVWEISKQSFWMHIKKACEHEDGLVLADHDGHIDPLRTDDIPSEVWRGLLWTLTKAETKWGGYGDDMESVLASIIDYQTRQASRKAERRQELQDWYHSLSESEAKVVKGTLETAFDGCIPEWLM